ncbi:nitrate reductase [Moniliophthora roreri]|uniref:Nitrate reductase n=1 Tax=Moniliophthora roreri TaxID=221103 RepID=A0A0W0F1N9_MONRR|nr:nitrate reductase [Moniliophthora roreri]
MESNPCPSLPNYFPCLPKNITPTQIAAADSQTPDSWVKRNPDLIRLTGKHPFNSEAQLSKLYDVGFLTPAHLHFVRNHGAVPRVDEEVAQSWKIHIRGLVREEVSLSISDLKSLFSIVTLPVTLVCAGNRRKEQNVVRKSLGFNWGSGGVSTALWTGVYLADVLEYVGADRRQAKHVIFEGGDSLPNGPYGTSQRFSWASDKERGMLIAWAMNGLPLEPDHGFPVRIIIPGQIGGRSVKWLKSIEVSTAESQHHLHYFDNRILPIQLSPEQARAEKQWWYDSRYLINELSVNSAIVKPEHAEELRVTSQNDSYEVRGYAYSGGGRRITRVELSCDDGRTWSLADIAYPEDNYRKVAHQDEIYGTLDLTERDTCFCWCFWNFKIPIDTLADSDCITVRAMDESGNMQPRDMYTNATSMLNNWWFRVAVVKRTDDTGCSVLRFEHPAPVGMTTPGWMERFKEQSLDVLQPQFSSLRVKEKETRAEALPILSRQSGKWTKEGVNRVISLEEFEEQAKSKCWFSISGEVYDATEYLSEHPGGEDSIVINQGEDATEDFMAIHSIDAKERLRQFHIGTLESISRSQRETESLAPTPAVEGITLRTKTSEHSSLAFLNPKKWKSLNLTEIIPSNYNTYTFRFALDHPEQGLGLPAGQHVFIRLKSRRTGELIQRAYTPISSTDEKGKIDFLIKLYFPNAQFPQGGKMTMCFYDLIVGQTVEVKGPFGSFIWKGSSTIMYKTVSRVVKDVGMVCAGSGITPIFQILTYIVNGELKTDANIRLWVLYANRTENDILCREQLESFVALAPKRFKLHYTLSTISGIPRNWRYGKGKVDEVMLRKHLPPPSQNGVILACGPDPMMEKTLKPCLGRIGWDISTSLIVF